MGKASSNKKVARAASTGGGRTARGKTPVLWYTVMTSIVVVGALLVAMSRNELSNQPSDTTAPVPKKDHWHAAYGIYVCDKFLPSITDSTDPKGIHTHARGADQGGGGDGIVHIHPFTSKSGGQNATLRRFAEAVKMDITRTVLDPPGDGKWKNGDSCTIDGKKSDGSVQLFVDGQKVEGDPLEYKFQRDRQQIVWAFAPKNAKVPPPPTVAGLDQLSDVGTTVPPGAETPPPGSTDPNAPADPNATAPAPDATAPSESTPATSTP
ncbi:MAG TPA: hypothetical protein VMY34_11355 [Acidimicrobiales bacterium]|nr:hypothetical protein [Acidimicrobiales bacterium]